MIKVSVMYPNQPGNHFDITYYCEKHIPLVHQLVGPALRQSAVDEGLSGMMPNTPAPFLAIGHLYFDSVAAFQEHFGPVLPQIVADLPRFTNSQPTVQISEVKLQS
jgi:uncharacterized protein (TIGR02118 family)